MAIVGKTSASPGYRISRNLLTGLLALFLVYSLAPVFYLVVAATKSNNDLFTSFGFWFADFAIAENIREVFSYQNGIFSTWLINSFIYSSLIAVGAALISTLAAYAFSKYEFFG